ncbi:n-alkane-inducible cytochrome P450 [Lecanosticta acicola]|uniref:N-alkane-inducible cytochrome P450 n=1 Tax=Lecanosticta acicola TaxID=111012 RepID=A0AAI9EET8_9PEZI|nr:n-alkane-inducible cytochrome P450 [Lecanosticta acicola]
MIWAPNCSFGIFALPATVCAAIENINPLHLLALASVLIACISHTVLRYIRLKRQRAVFKQQHGCKPAASTFPNRDPFGLTFTYNFLVAAKQARAMEWQHNWFQQLGPTFVNQTWRGVTAVWTNDPVNVRLLLTDIDRFLIEPSRHGPFKHLLGKGIFTTDGAFWKHSRNLLRPQFETNQFKDFGQFEHLVQKLLVHLQDEGSTVDLQPLFNRFTMDASTWFLTGTCANSLDTDGQAERARRFVREFDYSMDDAILQARLGWMYHLVPHPEARRANRACRDYIGSFVATAVENRSKESKAPSHLPRYTFVTELANHTELDEVRIRDEACNILLAGRDTTASLLTHMWFHLARRPLVWKTLQAEVDELDGRIPTHKELQGMKYLDYCAKEALRLHPAVPILSKYPASDTYLPRGGGPDGREPLFVPKAIPVFYNSYSMQRSKQVFGEDADVFRPERWADESFKPGDSYIPFGLGPRLCLGQRYALSEASYATVRMMQNFRRIESRDPGPWQEKLNASMSSRNGAKVALWKD